MQEIVAEAIFTNIPDSEKWTGKGRLRENN